MKIRLTLSEVNSLTWWFSQSVNSGQFQGNKDELTSPWTLYTCTFPSFFELNSGIFATGVRQQISLVPETNQPKQETDYSNRSTWCHHCASNGRWWSCSWNSGSYLLDEPPDHCCSRLTNTALQLNYLKMLFNILILGNAVMTFTSLLTYYYICTENHVSEPRPFRQTPSLPQCRWKGSPEDGWRPALSSHHRLLHPPASTAVFSTATTRRLRLISPMCKASLTRNLGYGLSQSESHRLLWAWTHKKKRSDVFIPDTHLCWRWLVQPFRAFNLAPTKINSQR